MPSEFHVSRFGHHEQQFTSCCVPPPLEKESELLTTVLRDGGTPIDQFLDREKLIRKSSNGTWDSVTIQTETTALSSEASSCFSKLQTSGVNDSYSTSTGLLAEEEAEESLLCPQDLLGATTTIESGFLLGSNMGMVAAAEPPRTTTGPIDVDSLQEYVPPSRGVFVCDTNDDLQKPLPPRSPPRSAGRARSPPRGKENTITGKQPLHLPLTKKYQVDLDVVEDASLESLVMLKIEDPHGADGCFYSETDESVEELHQNTSTDTCSSERELSLPMRPLADTADSKPPIPSCSSHSEALPLDALESPESGDGLHQDSYDADHEPDMEHEEECTWSVEEASVEEEDWDEDECFLDSFARLDRLDLLAESDDEEERRQFGSFPVLEETEFCRGIAGYQRGFEPLTEKMERSRASRTSRTSTHSHKRTSRPHAPPPAPPVPAAPVPVVNTVPVRSPEPKPTTFRSKWNQKANVLARAIEKKKSKAAEKDDSSTKRVSKKTKPPSSPERKSSGSKRIPRRWLKKSGFIIEI